MQSKRNVKAALNQAWKTEKSELRFPTSGFNIFSSAIRQVTFCFILFVCSKNSLSLSLLLQPNTVFRVFRATSLGRDWAAYGFVKPKLETSSLPSRGNSDVTTQLCLKVEIHFQEEYVLLKDVFLLSKLWQSTCHLHFLTAIKDTLPRKSE